MKMIGATGSGSLPRRGRPPLRGPHGMFGNPMRLKIAKTLAAAEPMSMSFVHLRNRMRTNDGLLSRHARRLEMEGYLTVTKRFVNRFPRTEYRLSTMGHAALRIFLGRR